MTSPGALLPEAELPNSSLCPRCCAGFRCSNVAGDAECWCTQLPHVMPVPAARPLPLQPDNSAASCFCPACLKQITDERTPTPAPAHD
ncbi:MAG TPA: hypothetical protein DCP03_02530 [Polaromonas sp.]|uniref:cysteine-rich CWC family protein n=1 Tax=Polaromonas sp. UBA4122 TaxID=1947074 RepID=UPI000EBB5300|nr:cysteine-rich CWC family protein [Polaromonas sp. UBA4122]HAL37040.1 hypothetical protein [Polaromonas sp.]